MGKTDKETLEEMGFPRNRVDKAFRKTGGKGLQAAMDWLIAHSDDADIDDPDTNAASQTLGGSSAAGGAAAAAGGDDDMDEDAPAAPPAEGEAVAKSFKCSVCGKILRDSATVQLHAVRTGHEEFEESTTEIAPLTEEQKKEQLARLKEKAAEVRKLKAEQEKAEEVRREQERRKLGKVSNEVQQKYMEAQQAKKLEEERRARQEELAYKEKLKREMEKDKAERIARRKADSGAAVSVTAPAAVATAAVPAAVPAAAPVDAPKKDYAECRIQVRLTNNQTLTGTFKADEPFQVALAWIAANRTDAPGRFQLLSTFPRRVFTEADAGKTFKELELVPSCSLTLRAA